MKGSSVGQVVAGPKVWSLRSSRLGIRGANRKPSKWQSAKTWSETPPPSVWIPSRIDGSIARDRRRTSWSISRARARCPANPVTGPSQDAESGVGLDLKQGLQGVALRTGKAGVNLSIDMTFRLQQGGRNQALDDTGSGRRNGASSQFLQQRAGERRAAGGGKRHREQPLGQFVLVGPGEGLEPVDGIQSVELIISGLRSGRVVGQDFRGKVELIGDENQYLPWHDFAGLQQAAGEPQGTELDGKAQTIVRPPAPRDDGEVGRVKCVMADQVGLGLRQREQCFKLGVGDGARTWHGGSVPIGVMSVQSSGEPS